MRLTNAQRTARYRQKHPERIVAYRVANADVIRDKNAEYRARVGTHPMNTAGTDSYKKYRASAKYRLAYINNHLKRRYGITFDEYTAMFEAQNGNCKICGSDTPNRQWKSGRTQYMKLFVDHDHKTGKVRGLLCNTCNQGIAALKEDVDILRRAIIYLSQGV